MPCLHFAKQAIPGCPIFPFPSFSFVSTVSSSSHLLYSFIYKSYSSSFSPIYPPHTRFIVLLGVQRGKTSPCRGPVSNHATTFREDIQYFTKFEFCFGTSQSSELPLLPVLALLLKSLRPFRPRRNKPNVFDLMMKPSVLILRQINQMCNSKLCRKG